MDVSVRDKGIYAFGPFRLDPVRRTLMRDGVAVKLAPRLFETLLYLVENPGRVVEKDELLAAVWSGRIVEEANLSQTIFALRKVLQIEGASDSFIATAPGRGYRFATPVSLETGAAATSQAAPIAPAAAVVSPAPRPHRQPVRWRPALLVAIVGLIAATAGTVIWRVLPASRIGAPSTAQFAPPPHSVAVLAFTNMSGDPREEDFSDGLSEQLIDSLSRVDALRVAARTSAFSFKGRPATIADIARQLNVGAVLEGSVRRDGARLRITAQLIDAITGYHFWSRSYDRDDGDVLELQGQIAASVTDSLKVTLLGNDAAKLTLGGTENPKAFDAYLRGMKLLRSGEVPAYHAALAAFDEAVALDPAYAMAQAQRARAFVHIASFDPAGTHADETFFFQSARDAADKAVQLAPQLGVAHAARADVLESGFQDFIGAQAELSRAVELARGDAWVQMYFAAFEIEIGHVAAGIEAAKHAVALDPLTANTYAELGANLYYAKHYDEALAAVRHAEALESVVPTRDLDLRGLAEVMSGDFAAARQTCAGARDWSQNECLAIAYHGLGQPSLSDAQFAKMRAALGSDNGVAIAEVDAQLGRTEAALLALRQDYEAHGSDLDALREDPMLDPIRDTSEFKDIERRLNFPP
jgi:TolB-like protein/DNA-binding winged helix-turn-helix (wHTH) protein/Tfp pilus assembly protein PilF